MNVGDFIIMDSAYKQICKTFPHTQKVHFPTHERITRVGIKRQRQISLNFLCGTNCLNSSMLFHRQWNIGMLNTLFMKDTVTLGVGWANYQNNPDNYTSLLLRNILSKKHIHSVRDSYTEKLLRSTGVQNILNTGCPTMWDLNNDHCTQIPSRKSKNVIFTLTDYRKDSIKDSIFIRALKKSYEDIYFWIQGANDYAYLQSLGNLIQDIKIIPANLSDFDAALSNTHSVDYAGTRLHAGIRAMQKFKRSIILSVDNRAEEKKKDFNLPVISRDLSLEEYIHIFNGDITTNISLPLNNIQNWKNQFS
ncbi:polysaccharide pyruvyl transferase family protein [Enterobacter chuandaensis]|uniref:polysaccharide pyruvyl transferase family protein n=1 Tax=Enterobacter chuandaensis TaxID=2497875 RepID=UPI003D6DF2DE